MILERKERTRVRQVGDILRASAVAVVVEIVSSSSRRIDNVVKRAEYAEAGIPNYWIIDLDEPVSLLSCRLTERFGYVDDPAVTGTFSTDQPVPLTVDLAALLD